MFGVAVLLVFKIRVSCGLQEQLTNLNVAVLRRTIQRSPTIAEYRELKRSKHNKHSACFFKKHDRGGSLTCL
jgi:hypothetical protein